jgi:hypothetical protein
VASFLSFKSYLRSPHDFNGSDENGESLKLRGFFRAQGGMRSGSQSSIAGCIKTALLGSRKLGISESDFFAINIHARRDAYAGHHGYR